MTRRLVIGGVAGLLLVGMGLLVVAGRSLYSRATFGTWDPAAPPNRIEYCDRRYYPGSHVSRADIEATGKSLVAFTFRQVGTTADSKPIFAKALPDNIRHQYPNAAPLPCAMAVYLNVGRDDYIAYGISGGP